MHYGFRTIYIGQLIMPLVTKSDIVGISGSGESRTRKGTFKSLPV